MSHNDGACKSDALTVRLPGGGQGPDRCPTAAPATGRRLRVLVVDDDHDTAESLSLLLGLWGHEVRRAYDALQALAEARGFQPEVVLSDLGLPGMDGRELGRQLRLEGLASAALIALTGYTGEEEHRRSLQAGFDRHLIKPVDLDELQALLEEIGRGSGQVG